MSTSQFPNATEIKVVELGQLVDDLLVSCSDPVKGEELVFFITNAYICAAVESMLVSTELKALGPLDQAVVQKIKDKLRECQ